MSRYAPEDPRLQPVPLSAYAWSPLPAPRTPDAVVRVSMIPTSTLTLDAALFTTFAAPGDKVTCPCWSFLIEKDGRAILWDLGLRENEPKKITEHALQQFAPHPGPGPIKRLAAGGFDVSTIDLVILSHEHFDLRDLLNLTAHARSCSGDLDTLPSPAPPILLGPGSLESTGPKGAPDDPNAAWPAAWLETYRFVELPSASAVSGGAWGADVPAASLGPGENTGRRWEAVGCFERAVDWFGDGSFWVIDAPGHSAGHLMALARVTASPPTSGLTADICLGSDAAHSQDLYLPVPSSSSSSDGRSPNPVIDGVPQLASDLAAAMRTVGALTRASAEADVVVVLSHEGEVAGVFDDWPRDLGDWKARGWKEAKERGVYERARARARAAEAASSNAHDQHSAARRPTVYAQ